ncbi:MAG: type I pullulanase [Oscillospiraceae bacterium]|nr:type I pullulanase [Oscillospiraceae bacterium]
MKQTTYDRRFDALYRYDGRDLGCLCAEGRTVFKLWSPEAQRVELSLYRDGVSEAYEVLPLARGDRGVWQAAVDENLHGTYYDYAVWTNGVRRTTADPYAMACGRNGGRSMAVDLPRTRPEGWDSDRPPAPQPEQIIYELHVKDFSFDPDSGVPAQYRGKFKAFSWRDEDGGLPACMEHLAGLGVTHVQLLPVFDFGSVDEGGSEEQFNWGYDPVNYNVPEGSYATDPSDGAARIRECREMIQALHQNGLRVVMDVVYNHTYRADSWLERSAPGYYYRRNEDGSLSDGSACGNDIAAGRAMVDNYIVNSVLYWAREYHIDGFRFDLMGLLTVELMNRIRAELDAAFGPGEKLMYGEPWRARESPMEPGSRPVLKNALALLHPDVGVFCDLTRDAIKGDAFIERAPGFVNGGAGREQDILRAVIGWRDGWGEYTPRSCSQIVNYVSAHDNFTLWDKLVMCLGVNGDEAGAADLDGLWADVLEQNKLAAFICFTCQGRLFFQAGEEFGRTKLGEGNSFRSPPRLNMLCWERVRRFEGLTDYYRQLIRLRKSLPGLCDKSPAAAERVTARSIRRPKVVSFQVERGGPLGERLLIAYNASDRPFSLSLPHGRWIVRADGRSADQRRPAQRNEIGIPPCSGVLLLREGD